MAQTTPYASDNRLIKLLTTERSTSSAAAAMATGFSATDVPVALMHKSSLTGLDDTKCVGILGLINGISYPRD